MTTTPPRNTLHGLASRIAAAAFQTGQYHLPDGTELPAYFDPYRLASDPQLLSDVAAALAARIPPATQLIAAPIVAGVPLATAVSLQTGLPVTYLRPRRKTHGTRSHIDGADPAGRQTILIDDTARTGTSLVHAASLLTAAGALVHTAACVLDRDLGATARLAAQGIHLHVLITEPASTTTRQEAW